jgi:CBS domain-containing protein
MIAREVMTPTPARVFENARVRDAVEMLQTLDVRHLPVVNEDEELVGMLSDRDLRGLAVPDVNAGELQGTVIRAMDASVATVMSSSIVSVEEEDEIEDVVDLMLETKVGAVPVVDGDGVLVGIISYIDVLRKAAFE